MTAPASGAAIVEGTGPLAAAIAGCLEEAGATVDRLQVLEQSDPGTIARVRSSSVLILADDDDTRNTDLALWARRIRPDLPLVARVFDATLADYLSTTIERITVLSMSAVAAPVFAEATQRLLATPGDRRAPPVTSRRRQPRARAPAVDRVLLGALLGFALLVIPSTAFFARALDLRAIDALYFVWTTVMTVGYGDISLHGASDVAKVVGMLLMLAGAAFMATLFALLTGWVITRRLEVLQGRVRTRFRRHVVVVGAGNLGLRVAGLLAGRGWRLVIVDRDADARNLAALRGAGHHVIVADASDPHVLDLAGVDHASAVLALTDSDAMNLQIALELRARGGDRPVVMRVTSAGLSDHITQRRDGTALSSVAVAARAFAAAALESRRYGVG